MENEKLNTLIEATKVAISNAEKNISSVSNDWRVMDQFSVSSKRFKLLLNNICNSPNATYLELGCFRGGTVAAAATNNKLLAVYAVDNFTYNPLGQYKDSEGKISPYCPTGWPNIRISFNELIERLGLEKIVKLFNGDWNKIPDTFIKHKIDIVHLDIEPNTKKILEFYDSKFSQVFTLVVSNYNLEQVRKELEDYIKEKNLKVHFSRYITSSSNSDSDGWWNGAAILVLEKQVANA